MPSNSHFFLQKFLGTGSYPVMPREPEFSQFIEICHTDFISLIRPRTATLPENPNPNHSHSHESYEFTINFSDSPLLQMGNHIYRLNRGYMTACNPGVHHGPAEIIESADFLAIQIDPTYMQGIASSLYGLSNLKFENRLFKPSALLLNTAFRFMEEFRLKTPGYTKMLDCLGQELVVLLLRESFHNLKNTVYPTISNYQPAISKAVQWMTESLAKDISLEKIARQANLSPFHFSRIFKQATGKTLYGYLTELRIKKAAQLLKSAFVSISETASACGFSNQSHFTRSFKTRMGFTPSAYQKLFTQNNEDTPS